MAGALMTATSQMQLVGLPSAQPATSESDEAYTIDSAAYPVIRLCSDFFGGIGLDPTANPQKTIPARHHMTKADNSLNQSWKDKGAVYMNPPYSCADVFLAKLVEEYLLGHCPEAIALIIATTACSKKCGPLIKTTAAAQCWIHGRLRFRYGSKERMGQIGETLTVPSTLIYWGERVETFQQTFNPLGTCSALAKGPQIPPRLGPVQKRMLQFLLKHGPHSLRGYADALGTDKSTVSKALKALRARELISGQPPELTATGLAAAAHINRTP
jgi:hypothetical protein